MRIITGEARGKRLSAAPGIHTRPTTDRVKESIFNIIQFDIGGRAVLDLFCGSGQMGLEALSRGARYCRFVDNDRAALDTVRCNIKACKFEERCDVTSGDAISFLARQEASSFGLIFIDPPYSGKLLNKAMEDIVRFDILAQGGIIVCESSSTEQLALPGGSYAMLREYIYGNTKITTFTRQ